MFDDGKAPFGVIPEGLNSTDTEEEKLIPADKVIEIIKRNFKKLLASEKEKYFKFADFIRSNGWEKVLKFRNILSTRTIFIFQ